MNLQLHYYLLCISRVLTCKGEQKRNFLNFIKNNLLEYVGEHPTASFQQVKAGFGTPEEVIEKFGLNEEPVKKRFLGSRPILKIVLTALSGAVALFVVYFLVVCLLQSAIPAVPLYNG